MSNFYPRWKYHATESALVVADETEESALGDGWYDTPAEASEANATDDTDDADDRRQALLGKAAELGLTIHHRAGVEKIQAAIDEHVAQQE